MSRPGLVLDFMDQLREAAEELKRTKHAEEKLQSSTSPSKAQSVDDLLVVAAISCATAVFKDAQAAQQWLTQQCRALGFVRPMDLLADCEGFSQVLAVLVRIQKNIYT